MLASIDVTRWCQLVYILSLLFRLTVFDVSFFLSLWSSAWSFYIHLLSFFFLLLFLIIFCFVCCFIFYINKTSHFTSWCCSFRSMCWVFLFFRPHCLFAIMWPRWFMQDIFLEIVLIESVTICISWSFIRNKRFLIYKMKSYFTLTLQVKVWNSIPIEHLHDAHSNGNASIHEKRGVSKWSNL